VPQPSPLHPGPDTVHITAVFDLPVTVAVNCWVPPILTEAELGETETLVGLPSLVDFLLRQPAISNQTQRGKSGILFISSFFQQPGKA